MIGRATHVSWVYSDCLAALREATLKSGARQRVYEAVAGDGEVMSRESAIKVIEKMREAINRAQGVNGHEIAPRPVITEVAIDKKEQGRGLNY